MASVAAGLHFYMKPGEVKCFYESLSVGNLLTGDIDGLVQKNGVYMEDPRLRLGISLYETFNDDHLVLRQQNHHTGEFTFTALEAGEHKICIQPSYAVSDVSVRIFMEFDIGYVKTLDGRRKGDLQDLQERTVQLTERLQNIHNKQKQIIEKEALFRSESEAANSRIVFWVVLQAVCLVLVCLFQIRYLGNFFVKQKMI